MRHATLGVVVALAVLLIPVNTAAQAGAKVFFYDPAGGKPEPSAGVPPSPATGLTPVKPNDLSMRPRFVGIHYWFQNESGNRFTEARAAGVGTRVRLHLRSNVPGYVTVWKADGSGQGVQLTSMKSQYPGYLLQADREYIVPSEFVVPRAESGTRLLVWFSRSQTQQVGSAADARDEIQRVSAGIGRDGLPSLVRETDSATPGQVGNYVVDRYDNQAGVDFVF
jgi:hypothetical protein